MVSITEVISELLLFSNHILEVNHSASAIDVGKFEKRFNLKLPQDYKDLLKVTNGFSLMGTLVYGIEQSSSNSLSIIYLREHEEVENVMFDYLVPFSPDGGGNHYCFDTRTIKHHSCNVVFWQHDYPYTEHDLPEVTNSSFSEWIKEVVIDWKLEDYDYDGSEK